MAGFSISDNVQIVNIDLAVERQKILREKLKEYFKALSSKGKSKKEIVYTINQSNSSIDQVVRVNPDVDALFTSFNYDISISEDYKETQMINSVLDASQFSPGVRYPVIGTYLSLVDRGFFRPRKLILVGDVYEKIEQAIKSQLPIEVNYFTNPERTEISQPIKINSHDQVVPHNDKIQSSPEKITASQIHSLTIAGIPFSGVINMPEIKNKFVLADQTILDTTRKLFTMEGAKEVKIRESLEEEKLTFVRGKKVFLVLEKDLDHIVSGRLVFDKMQRIYRHHSLQEALDVLEHGKSQGIYEYFENEGYDVIFEVFDNDERDKLLLEVISERLGGVLEKEIQTQKGNISMLEEGDVDQILKTLPEPVIDQLLIGLQKISFEKFLALVPLKIRENVIQTFLSNKDQVKGAWNGMKDSEKKEILNGQAPRILAFLYTTNTPSFQKKFSNLKFEFTGNIHSSSLAKMGKEEQQATYKLLVKSLEKAKPPPGIIPKVMKPEEIEEMISGYILRNPGDFFNRLNPLIRKQLWHTVGREFRDQITSNLHYLDKTEILKGNKDAALELLFSNPEFLTSLKSEENAKKAGKLLMTLKKHNKIESKTALLKKVLTETDWAPYRAKHIRAFFSDPENQHSSDKLADHLDEGFDFSFDSLICTRADYEELKQKEPLQKAMVILVDDMVDNSLFTLFQEDGLSQEDYDSFSHRVEEEIAALKTKMGQKEADDPVGIYLIESMQMLNEMTNQAFKGQFDGKMLEKLDQRKEVRERMISTMKEHLAKVRDFLGKADGQEKQLDQKIKKATGMEKAQSQTFDKSYNEAMTQKKSYQELIKKQARLMADKKKVALTQKELSLQFFQLIQPLILSKVRSSAGIFKSILRKVGFFRKDREIMARRIIFKFSDEDITNILDNEIIFCSKDEILMQFILTCLRIDNLQDSLFTLATPETLPKGKIDVLFYGPGYVAEDFIGLVKKKRVVPFADQDFIELLTGNEKKKANTKQGLVRLGNEMKKEKGQLELVSKKAKEQQSKLNQISNALNKLNDEKNGLLEKVTQQKERELHFQTEVEMLETRISEVDERFDEVKKNISAAGAEAEGGAISLIAEGKEALGKELQHELIAMNKELARMMFIKGVKDAGDQISKKTQNAIIKKMEDLEKLPLTAHPIKKILVADDGSNVAQNLKRVFINVASAYFKMREGALEDITIKRLESRADDGDSKAYPFVAVMADQQDTNYDELKKVIKKVRAKMPNTYQLVFAPFGEIWTLDPNSEFFKNIRVIKENSCLINTGIADYTHPPNILRILSQKAPRR